MARQVLVLNSGSSSFKYALYKLGETTSCIFKGVLEGIGAPKSKISHKNVLGAHEINIEVSDVINHRVGLSKVKEVLVSDHQDMHGIRAIGHRVTHGGESLTRPALITESVKQAIEAAIPLAPLHNPPNLEGIKVAQEVFKSLPQVAVFDTAFHSTIPAHAYMYAIPLHLYKELGLRRYGFHGTSYQYVLGQTASILSKPKEELNVIICHIGAGASMAAISQGKCIDTTMGVTPLEGLVMATRCGDVDPGIMQILADERKLSVSDMNKLLNKESGLFGLCGEKDMKTVIDAAAAGSEAHRLALDVFVHRIRKYLGAYLVHLEGKVDALVFTAGIGERSSVVRAKVCERLEALGVALDEAKNTEDKKVGREIQNTCSKVKVLVIPTDEELCIAQQTLEVVGALSEHESMGLTASL